MRGIGDHDAVEQVIMMRWNGCSRWRSARSPARAAGLRNRLKASAYCARNFAITTSGLEDLLVLRFRIDKTGIDNIMWAIDYPYQPTRPPLSRSSNRPRYPTTSASGSHMGTPSKSSGSA